MKIRFSVSGLMWGGWLNVAIGIGNPDFRLQNSQFVAVVIIFFFVGAADVISAAIFNKGGMSRACDWKRALKRPRENIFSISKDLFDTCCDSSFILNVWIVAYTMLAFLLLFYGLKFQKFNWTFFLVKFEWKSFWVQMHWNFFML